MKRKKLSIILCCATLILAFMVPQTAFATDVSYTISDKMKQSYLLDIWGGPEIAGEGSLRVYWGDFSSNAQDYQLSWKKADSKEWKSVEIKNPEEAPDKVKSYVITDLEKNQKYDIKISAILKDQNGKTIYTTPAETTGYTYVTTPEYEPYSCLYNGTYVESTWNVHERTSMLKFYRADSKDGAYEFVGQTDCRDTTGHANYRDTQRKVVFRDTTAKPGMTYYYKAVNEITLDDGTVVKAESPRGYNLTAKLKPYGKYTAKLINTKGTYAKTLTWKLTSDKANYKTKLIKKSIVMKSKSSTTGKWLDRKPVSVQYSYNGKTYYNMKDSLTIQPGKTVYLRINLKNKLWIRKDGQGNLYSELRYYYNDKRGNVTYTEHWYDMTIGVNGKVSAYWGDQGDQNDAPPSIDDEYLEDDFYKASHNHGYAHLTAAAGEEKNVLISWMLCPFAEGYVLRFGTTEAEAQKSEPISVPRGQAAYALEGLKEGTQYYVILCEMVKDENGNLQEEQRPYGPATVTIPGGE